MRRRYLPLGVTALVMGAFALLTAFYYPHLPPRLATHFGPNGLPDGWMAKDEFVRFYAGILFVVMATTAGTGALIERVPTDAINLPNKEYWLAPERRASTLGYLRLFMNRMGGMTGTLMIVLLDRLYHANLVEPVRLDNTVYFALLAFSVAFAACLIGLVQRFRR